MTDTLELLDVAAFLHSLQEDSPGCTSRSLHKCTQVATHCARSGPLCPDPVRLTYWCMDRYKRYQFHSQWELNCSWCKRATSDCWIIWPI